MSYGHAMMHKPQQKEARTRGEVLLSSPASREGSIRQHGGPLNAYAKSNAATARAFEPSTRSEETGLWFPDPRFDCGARGIGGALCGCDRAGHRLRSAHMYVFLSCT